ncbi:MAG: VIT1/CCC1 transporter family protein [Rhodothalassiaceae bacterium]
MTDAQRLEHEHSREAIAHRLATGRPPSYVRDWVQGGIDGAITSFAIVAGAVGGGLGARVIVILGLSSLVADAVSMAAANFSGTRAEAEERTRLLRQEERHIARDPAGERREIEEIYRRKGVHGAELSRLVDILVADKARWIDVMLREEYGLAAQPRSPWRAGLATFAAFLACGVVPIVPFLTGVAAAPLLAALLTALVFAGIGWAKGRLAPGPAWAGALEILLIGSAAATAAYAAGALIDRLV